MFYKKGFLKVTPWCRCFAVNFGKYLKTPPGAVNLVQCFKEDFYKKLHNLLALRIDCLYLFWKLPEFLEMQIHFIRIMLIRILSLKNDSCIFFSSLEFLHFDFLSGDGGATT